MRPDASEVSAPGKSDAAAAPVLFPPVAVPQPLPALQVLQHSDRVGRMQSDCPTSEGHGLGLILLKRETAQRVSPVRVSAEQSLKIVPNNCCNPVDPQTSCGGLKLNYHEQSAVLFAQEMRCSRITARG